MKEIWKFPLESPSCKVIMPRGAKILTARIQSPSYGGSVITLWAEVSPGVDRGDKRSFKAVNTGREVPEGEYIGTCEASSGIIWHVYEVTGGDN